MGTNSWLMRNGVSSRTNMPGVTSLVLQEKGFVNRGMSTPPQRTDMWNTTAAATAIYKPGSSSWWSKMFG